MTEKGVSRMVFQRMGWRDCRGGVGRNDKEGEGSQ